MIMQKAPAEPAVKQVVGVEDVDRGEPKKSVDYAVGLTGRRTCYEICHSLAPTLTVVVQGLGRALTLCSCLHSSLDRPSSS